MLMMIVNARLSLVVTVHGILSESAPAMVHLGFAEYYSSFASVCGTCQVAYSALLLSISHLFIILFFSFAKYKWLHSPNANRVELSRTAPSRVTREEKRKTSMKMTTTMRRIYPRMCVWIVNVNGELHTHTFTHPPEQRNAFRASRTH